MLTRSRIIHTHTHTQKTCRVERENKRYINNILKIKKIRLKIKEKSDMTLTS